MSYSLYQDMILGYATTYDEFVKLTGGADNEDYDDLMAENREDKFGWLICGEGDDYAIYGQLLLEGEYYSNDAVIGAESGMLEMPDLPEDNTIHEKILAMFPDINHEQIKPYITVRYM